MSFSKPSDDHNDIEKYLAVLHGEVASVLLGQRNVASGEELLDLLKFHPPRAKAGGGYLDANAADGAGYKNLAVFETLTLLLLILRRKPSINFGWRMSLQELQHSSPYRQHANGLIERAWQSIHTRSAAMRDAANLNYNTWWYTDNHAAKLHNVFPSTIHGGKSPHELVYGSKLNTDIWKTIGQRVVVKRQIRTKSQAKGRVGIWLGRNESLSAHIIAFEKNDTDVAQPPIIHTKDISTDPKPQLQNRLVTGKANIEAPGYIPFDINLEIDGNLYDIDTNNVWKDNTYKSGFAELLGAETTDHIDAPSVHQHKKVRVDPSITSITSPPPHHHHQPILMSRTATINALISVTTSQVQMDPGLLMQHTGKLTLQLGRSTRARKRHVLTNNLATFIGKLSTMSLNS